MKRMGLVVVAGAAVLAGGLAVAHADEPKLDARKADAGKSDAGRPDSARPDRRTAPFPSGSAWVRNWQADMADAYRKHRPSTEQMNAAMAAARASAKARRQAHLAEVRKRYPEGELSRREVFGELRVHAKRMAFLNRARFVATTELEEPKRASALARIEKLTAAEQARHEHRIEGLRANAAVIASAAPSALPVQKSSAP